MATSVLKGARALVTGGAGGLGVSECATLARAGAEVVMLDLAESAGEARAREINGQIGRDAVRFFVADLSELHDARERVSALADELGGFDILVNNAAVNPTGPIESYDLDWFEKVERINTHAAFMLCQLVTPAMKSKGAGQIVNMCSLTLSGGWSDFVPYVMSKGSLLGLTRALARELGPFGIRVNAVSPGAIPTDLERRVFADRLEEYNALVLERQSLKFRASEQDVADAVLFLVGPQSRFITGHELHVNGGWYMG